MSDSDQRPPRRKPPWKIHHEAGLAEARVGNIAAAISHYEDMLQLRVQPDVLADVLALGEPGKILLRKRRDLCETQIRQTACRHYTVHGMQLYNAFLNEPERDLRFYEELCADPFVKDVALLNCIGAVMIRLEGAQRLDELRPYAVAFSDRLEKLVTNSQIEDKSKVIRRSLRVCVRTVSVRAAIYSGDANLVSGLVHNLLIHCPCPLMYCELQRLAETHGAIIQVPLDQTFARLSLLERLTIIVSECLADWDQEGYVRDGAPRDEYESVAASLVATLRPDTTIDELTISINKVFQSSFSPYERPPNLVDCAQNIYDAVHPFLNSLPR